MRWRRWERNRIRRGNENEKESRVRQEKEKKKKLKLINTWKRYRKKSQRKKEKRILESTIQRRKLKVEIVMRESPINTEGPRAIHGGIHKKKNRNEATGTYPSQKSKSNFKSTTANPKPKNPTHKLKTQPPRKSNDCSSPPAQDITPNSTLLLRPNIRNRPPPLPSHTRRRLLLLLLLLQNRRRRTPIRRMRRRITPHNP